MVRSRAGRVEGPRGDELVDGLVGLVVAHVEHELPASHDAECGVLVAEAAQGGVLAALRRGVVGIVLADPAVLAALEGRARPREVLGRCRRNVRAVLLLGARARRVDAVPPVGEVLRRVAERYSVAVVVLLAGECGAPRRRAAGAVRHRAVGAVLGAVDLEVGGRGAGGAGLGQRAGVAQRGVRHALHLAAEDAAVVGRRRDDRPGAVGAAAQVDDRVARHLLLQLDVGDRLRRTTVGPGGRARLLRLEPVLEEGVGVLVVDEQQPLLGRLEGEERRVVVVVAEPVDRAVGVGERVVVGDDDRPGDAGRGLEGVGARGRDRGELRERRGHVCGLGVGDEVGDPGGVEAVERGRGAGAGDRQVADEGPAGRAGELAGLLVLRRVESGGGHVECGVHVGRTFATPRAEM